MGHVQAIEQSVRELPSDQQLFSPVYRLDADRTPAHAERELARRQESTKLLRMGLAAAGRALVAPKDEHYARRLREPMETAVEAIAADPDNLAAYGWAAYLNALIEQPLPALNFFLTLVFRMRVAERILESPIANPNNWSDPNLSQRGRIQAAATGRLNRDFWSTVQKTAELLQLKNRIALSFPQLEKLG